MSPPGPAPDWLFVFVDPNNVMAVHNLRITGQYTGSVVAAMATEPAFASAYARGTTDFLPLIPDPTVPAAFQRNPSMSTQFLSPFVVSTVTNAAAEPSLYRVEYDAELVRRQFFKDSPSRLTGVFAFESMDACGAASQQYGWDLQEVQRFQPQTVLRSTRVNMGIVSLARAAYRQAALEEKSAEALWRAYWSRAADPGVDLPGVDAEWRLAVATTPTWEWIIDGTLLHESRVATR